MRRISRLKANGYLLSIGSVVLLAVPAWEGASHDPLLLACLVGGVILSIGAMAMRWRSHRVDVKNRSDT